MPILLPPLSRRHFLAGAVATGAGLAAGWSRGDDALAVDPHRIALFSDTHVAADPKRVTNMVNTADNMRQAALEMAKLAPRPQIGIVSGDLALLKGEPGDYGTFLELLGPLRKAGLPVQLLLGNHDHRANFWAAVPPGDKAERPVESRHVAVVELERANLFLLDSLDKTNVTPGTLGEEQLAWLAKALDARPDKPAIVIGHHNVDMKAMPAGLIESTAFVDLIRERKQVKAYVFGHTHVWQLTERDGIHHVNLPPVAYVFKKELPSGWVDLRLEPDGATLELRCIDPTHAQHGKKVKLAWRK